MEAKEGFKERLKEALKKREFLKLIFQYPASQRAIVKRGYVEKCYDKSFSLIEVRDGKTTFSYDYLVEVRPEIELKGGSEAKK